MGANKIENSFNCPYCCKLQKCEGFQEIINLSETGWVVYRHVDRTEQACQVGGAGRITSTPQDTFILVKPKNAKAESADLLAQLVRQKIPCLRCKHKIEMAQNFFNKRPFSDTPDAVGVCDHCLMKPQTKEPCCKCAKIVNKFLAIRGGEQKHTDKYVKRWLTNMEHALNKTISEVRTQKGLQSTYSDIDINLLSRDRSESVVKCKVQEMFHSELNLSDMHLHPEKAQHLKKHELSSEKVVNFKELSEKIQTVNSYSNIKITEEKQDDIDIYNEYYGLETHPSEAEKQQRRIIGTVQDKEKSDHIMKEDEERIDDEKSIQYKTEKIPDSHSDEGLTFFFPETSRKRDTKLKRHISSSELIKDTQEKMRLKAEEEENKIREQLKFKAELEEKKKLAREEKKRLIKESTKITDESIIKSKDSDVTTKTKKEHPLEEKGKPKRAGLGEEPDEKLEQSKLEATSISEQKVQKKQEEFEEDAKTKQEITRLKEKDKLSEDRRSKEKDKLSEDKHTKGKDKPSEDTRSKEKDKLLEDKRSKEKDKPSEDKHFKEKDKPLEDKRSKEKDKSSEDKRSKDKDEHLERSSEPKSKMKKTGHEKEPLEIQDTRHSKEGDKSGKHKRMEDVREKELKMSKIKLQKQSIDKISAQLASIKKNELEKEQSASRAKKLEEINKLPELPKKGLSNDVEKGLEGKQETLQTTDKKSEKRNKAEETQEKDIKITQVKLQKQSTDNVLSDLVKLNKNEPKQQDVPKNKQPDFSKIMLDSTKKKEALEEKFANAQKKAEKEDDKTATPSKKETKEERELKLTQVKLVEHNFDNVILQLIKVKSSDREQAEKEKKTDILQDKKGTERKKKVDKVKNMPQLSEDDNSSEEYRKREELTQLKMLRRRKAPPQFQPPHREGQDVIPLYIRHELSEMFSSEPLKGVDEAIQAEERKKIDPEASKGIIRYALSDRSFIEKGWTMLPVEKIVRKMNIYRMRPAQPEFDWFEHNKHKGLLQYDSGAKLAEIDKNGRGQWFYQNGRLALDYYEAEETNTQQRFVVYSNGEQDERGRSRPVTILATFDHLGNGVVFDHTGKIRLKYNQTEGVLLDRSIGPATNWKWHTLNDPPVLQQVMIDTQMPLKDPKILKLGGPADNRTRPDNEEMLAIEFDNFIKEKSKKLTQKFKPFQIKMKALKINEQFSLKVLDQATIYLIFRDGSANLKINIGMILDHKEIVDTDTAELGDVSNSLERFPARTDSLAALQRSVAFARRHERMRLERENRLRHPERSLSIDDLGKAASRPLRPPLRMLTSPMGTSSERCKCSRKQSYSLYYNTRLL